MTRNNISQFRKIPAINPIICEFFACNCFYPFSNKLFRPGKIINWNYFVSLFQKIDYCMRTDKSGSACEEDFFCGQDFLVYNVLVIVILLWFDWFRGWGSDWCFLFFDFYLLFPRFPTKEYLPGCQSDICSLFLVRYSILIESSYEGISPGLSIQLMFFIPCSLFDINKILLRRNISRVVNPIDVLYSLFVTCLATAGRQVRY